METDPITILVDHDMEGYAILLQGTLREENTITSLPILTIGSLDHLLESAYREQCADRLVEIVLDLESHLGRGRIFIP